MTHGLFGKGGFSLPNDCNLNEFELPNEVRGRHGGVLERCPMHSRCERHSYREDESTPVDLL
jgi:hypothetical protein